MGGIGNCCCDDPPCSCGVSCDPYLPDPTWTLMIFDQSVVTTRHLSERCYYQSGLVCWNDDPEETNSWTEEIQAWGSTSTPINCLACCPGETYDVLISQVAVKAAQKRWRQVHHELYAYVYPVNVDGNAVASGTCTTSMRIKVEHTIAVVYFLGASWTAWTRWRKDSVTCDDPVLAVVGGWNSNTEPTMPSVDIPPCFNWLSFPVYFANFSDCPVTEGPAVTPTTEWGTDLVTTLRQIACGEYDSCVLTTVDGYAPSDLAIHKSCSTNPIYSFQWNYCVNPYVTIPDRLMAIRTYTYLSDPFDCSSLPSGDIDLTRSDSTISPSGSSESCGSQTFDFTWPTIPSTLTITV